MPHHKESRCRILYGLVAAASMLPMSAPCEAGAQAAPRAHVGAGLGLNLLVGDGSDFLDGGVGRFLFADFRLDERGRFGIRVDASSGGLEDDEDEMFDSRAENDLIVFVAGPQLTAHLGGRLRPYAAALAGMAAVHWETVEDVLGEEIEDDDAETAFAWGAHAGLGVVLDEGDHPVTLRFEARLLDTGALTFARAPAPNGTAPTGLIREDIAVFAVRVAISLGF